MGKEVQSGSSFFIILGLELTLSESISTGILLSILKL